MSTTKKRGPGRPKLGHTEDVEFKVSPALLKLIDKDAERVGIQRADWLRRAALAALSMHFASARKADDGGTR